MCQLRKDKKGPWLVSVQACAQSCARNGLPAPAVSIEAHVAPWFVLYRAANTLLSGLGVHGGAGQAERAAAADLPGHHGGARDADLLQRQRRAHPGAAGCILPAAVLLPKHFG